MDKIINQVLKENTIGIWKLDGNQLYGNDCFLDLIGVPKEMDAQACLKFHLSHVHPEDQEQFGEYVRKLSEERTEIVYRFLHPEKGVMMIRCSGKKNILQKPMRNYEIKLLRRMITIRKF